VVLVTCPCPPEFVIDNAGELALRLGAIQENSVNEKSWCTVYTSISALLLILGNVRLLLLGGQAGIKLLVIQLQGARKVDKRTLFQA